MASSAQKRASPRPTWPPLPFKFRGGAVITIGDNPEGWSYLEYKGNGVILTYVYDYLNTNIYYARLPSSQNSGRMMLIANSPLQALESFLEILPQLSIVDKVAVEATVRDLLAFENFYGSMIAVDPTGKADGE